MPKIDRANSKPNVVFIMADDLGYGDLGCYGALKISTPCIDAVAGQGMRFSDAHSCSAVCTPSRYGVLTGRYCWRSRLSHGVLGGFGAPLIEPERMTVASLLKGQGYTTAAVGKWHLGLEWTRKDGRPLFAKSELAAEADGIEAEHVNGFGVDYTKPFGGGPRHLGFDYFFGIAGSLDMPPYCFLEEDRTVGIPSLEKQPYEAQQRQGLMSEGWRDDLVDVTFAEKAVAFVRRHAREHPEAPFFLYLTPSAPHQPCLPPAFMRGRSDAGLRGDMVMVFDWVVGQVVEALKELGIEEDTLLLVTSDNGAQLTDFNGKDYGHKSNGDLRGGKADIWDGGHREPLVVRWPSVVPAGSSSDELVCLVDLLATCADILGERLPPNAAEDSASFLAVLRGGRPQRPVHEALVHHAYDGMFAIRKGDWKLIDGTGSGGFSEPRRYTPGADDARGQLYNLCDDRRETLNLWKEYRLDKVEELSKLLCRYRQEGRSF